MATVHHTRGAQARSAPQRRSAPGATACESTAPELTAALRSVALQLGLLYATCVTVRLALKAQNAEQDAEMARCLMGHVAEPLSVQMEVLHAIVKGLERGSTAALPGRS